MDDELFSIDLTTNTIVRHDVLLADRRLRINDDGDIVGTAQSGNGFLVKDGVHTAFGAGTSATRITNSGLIAGNSPSGAWIAHSSRPLDVLIQVPGFTVYVISEDGQTAVGSGPGGAMIWTPTNGLQDLNKRVESYTGWPLEVARFINSDGQFVGEGTQRSEEGHFNFLATPDTMRIRIGAPPARSLVASMAGAAAGPFRARSRKPRRDARPDVAPVGADTWRRQFTEGRQGSVLAGN
jgi:hypothetical protein